MDEYILQAEMICSPGPGDDLLSATRLLVRPSRAVVAVSLCQPPTRATGRGVVDARGPQWCHGNLFIAYFLQD